MMKWLCPILLFALAVRIAAAALLPDQSESLPDSISYREVAELFWASGFYGSSYHMPLYPLAIASLGPLQVPADIGLSVLIVWLIYALTLEIFSSERAALFTAMIASVYPALIFFSVVRLSETLFTALILATNLFWYRGRFALGSITATLAILTRPTFDVFAPILLLVFCFGIFRLSLKLTAINLAGYAAIYCLLMSPWWFLNYERFGTFVRLSPGGGAALYIGNNPMNKTGGGLLDVDYVLTDFDAIPNAIDRDTAMRNAAIRYIINDPSHFLKMAAKKFVRMWQPWPSNERYQNHLAIVAIAGSFIPIISLSAFALALNLNRLRFLTPILIWIIGYTLVHMIFLGTIRYRFPLEPFLIILAGGTIRLLDSKPHFAARLGAHGPTK